MKSSICRNKGRSRAGGRVRCTQLRQCSSTAFCFEFKLQLFSEATIQGHDQVFRGGARFHASHGCKTASAAPTKVALMTLEKSAYEAWKSKDAKFWDTFLSDKFVGYGFVWQAR